MIKVQNKYTIEHRFASPADLVSEFQRCGARLDLHGSWTGGVTKESLFHSLQHGDTTYVSEAERAIEEIMRGFRLETLRPEWIEDQAGAYADVPAFLAGNPMSMRRRVITTREIAPIKLFISTTSSCGVDIKTLTQRGICLLALVIALSRIRPTELHLFNAVEEYSYNKKKQNYQSLVDIVRMPTSPLDIGLVAFCLISQGYTRGLTYSYLATYDRDLLSNVPNRDLEECRKICGASEVDVVFPPIHLYDDYKNPTAWVKDRLTSILKLNEEQVETLT